MFHRDCRSADSREKNGSRDSTGVPRAGNADEQGRRPGSEAHRAAGPGQARYRSHAGPELSPFRLRGDPRHAVGRAQVWRQSLSRTDSADVSRRNADRASREQPRRPDHSGLLQPAVHAQGSVRPDLPGTDDLVTHKSPHARGSYQSEGKCRQRAAAHPSGNVEHLYLRHSQEHAAGTVLVSQSSSWAHCGAGLCGSRRAACHRTNGRQPAARHGEKHSDPEHGASVQLRL
jgi:hypothetical protein